MDLCYCYFNTKGLASTIERLKDVKSVSHYFSSGPIPKASLYWIEIDELCKENLSHITTLVKKNPHTHVYLFAPESLHKLLLFKFCLFFGIKDLLDTAISEEKLSKTLPLMLQQTQQAIQTKNTADFAKILYKNISFCSYTKGKITFVSEALQVFLGTNDKKTVAQRLPDVISLQESLHKDTTTNSFATQDNKGDHWKCLYQLSGENDYFIVTVTPY